MRFNFAKETKNITDMGKTKQNDYLVTICFKTYITKKVKALSEESAIEIAENQIDAMTDEEYSKVIVSNLSRDSATIQKSNVLTTGTIVMYRGNFGGGVPTQAKVQSIEICKEGEKYGIRVNEIPFSDKDKCTFILDDGHWCYGEQIDSIVV